MKGRGLTRNSSLFFIVPYCACWDNKTSHVGNEGVQCRVTNLSPTKTHDNDEGLQTMKFVPMENNDSLIDG